jgi:hypothetical protein
MLSTQKSFNKQVNIPKNKSPSDIDFARNCSNTTTQTHLEALIKANRAGKILDDRHKVGHHCISWIGRRTDETENIRFKVYKKLVQLLESAEVRKTLGS